ncbi:xanthine dehydrogenase accessory protein XdhC [Phaeobacter sp. J2-8]|uniref:xanthine dehydrogenase accessory protein XdhC n=1 Tax=Phaeobacter sp. J2-8 TaxID=2931394 RepID=UPI001FD2767D|nr:xanthine dehydrogenase accessory protein XdhC [Phaeobacter sp. J2-8]MCJ7874620.1 xanthine dehydrogenase accessory protein XdhC [Phaeobacter sp. J2-8]
MRTAEKLAHFLANEPAVRLRLTRVRGSSPRDTGTEMFVTAQGLFGTVGGGQLEHIAINAARDLLRAGDLAQVLDVPLGPEIGQCCGGRVEVTLHRMSAADKQDAIAGARAQEAAEPAVYILGAGHVGRALANLFQHLPVKPILIDQRREELAQSQAEVEHRQSAIPEVDIMTAAPGSAFIVLTHDHGLDFLLASAALERGDAAYVGLIGSATKRVKFRNWCRDQCDGLEIDSLVCPIGAGGSGDKRPAVIAAFVVADVLAALTAQRPGADGSLGRPMSQVAAE